jgi:hypothetical protein
VTYIVGVIGLAVLFGLFSMLRPRDAACTGHCAGCTRDGACNWTDTGAPNEEERAVE